MIILILSLIFIRPFICSLVYFDLNAAHAALLLALLGIYQHYKHPALANTRPLKYPLALLCAALFISLVFSQDKYRSLVELHKYASGILLFAVAASFSDDDKTKTIRTIVLAGFIISMWVLYQYFIGFRRIQEYMARNNIVSSFASDYLQRKRVFLPFITPNALGGYLAMVIPLTLTNKKIMWFLLPLSCALLCTKSLGAVLSLFFAIALYFWLVGGSKRKTIASLLGLSVVIAAVCIIRFANHREHLQPAFSTIMRLRYWQDTLNLISLHPLVGLGLGNFKLALTRYAHNSYLQIWAETGTIGILSFAVFLLAVYWPRKRNLLHDPRTAGLYAASAVFLMHNLIDFTFFLPEVALLWWCILGLGMDNLPATQEKPPNP